MSDKSTKSSGLTHVDETGAARMVDVSGKPDVVRTATAAGRIMLGPETLRLIRENQIAKGDVLATARIAGIMAAKRTADIIPLCHPIPIDQVSVELTLTDEGVEIEASARCVGRTGIEMEALTAVSAAALTVYDMCKAVDRSMRIDRIHLLEKTKTPISRQQS